MKGPDGIPLDPSAVTTAWQFGRHLAKQVRGRLTQEAVVKAIRRAAPARARLEPLTVQRVSAMENLKAGSLPTAEELRAYLVGCGQEERLAVLESVRLRLQAEYTDAERARERGAGTLGASSATGSAALAGLPGEVGFTGRDHTVRSLAAFLAPGAESAPVAVVAGLAGIGKTASVLHAAHQAVAAGWFPGGVLFLNLHGYDDDGGIDANVALSSFLSALAVPQEHIPRTQDEREAHFRSVLATAADEGRRVLVVADNVSSIGQVQALRPGHPAHRMLVTSRHTLPVPGARRIELDVLSPDDAIAVLAQALTAADPGDRRAAAEEADAAELVQLCGGLPLAVRITAELLADQPQQPIRELIRSLAAARDRLGELAYGDSVAVRLAFDASYRRLPADQARIFRLASLHPGPYFGVGVLQALADVPHDTARHVAADLRRAHLLQAVASPDGYQFHDLVKLYAGQRCTVDDSPDQQAAATDRLVVYYREAIRAAESHLDPTAPAAGRSSWFADRESAVAWLEHERPNLTAVIALAAGTGRDDGAEAMAFALRHFYNLSKHWDEWIATGLAGLAAVRRLGDRGGEARALNALSAAYQERRDFDEALTYILQALDIYRELGDPLGEAKALLNIGNVHLRRGESDEAITSYLRSLDIFRELDEAYGLGQILNNLGYAHNEARRFDSAADYYQQALVQFRKHGAGQAAVTMTNLGAVRRAQGRLREALDCHEQSLVAFRAFGDRHHEGRALTNLAGVRLDLGEHEAARRLYEQALAICRELGDRHGEGQALADLAGLCLRAGHPAEALAWYRHAHAAFVASRADDDAGRTRAAIAELSVVAAASSADASAVEPP